MGATCTICTHDDSAAIDVELVEKRAGLRDIARRFGVTKDALSRHRRGHVSPSLTLMAAERERESGITLLSRVEALIGRTESFLEAAERSGQVAQGLAAVRELRGLFELLGKASGELKAEAPMVAVNVLASPEIIRLQQTLMDELQSYPELRQRIAARWNALEVAA